MTSENGLIKLMNGDLVRATLELENKDKISERKYLKQINEKVESFGYAVNSVLRDVDNGVYHISIEKIGEGKNA